MKLKDFQQGFLEDLTNKKWAAKIEIETQQEIQKEQESTAQRMLDQIKISKDFIAEMEKDPSREARDKRRAEETKLAGLEKNLKDQQEEIDKTTKGVEKWQRQEEILSIYIKKAEENK